MSEGAYSAIIYGAVEPPCIVRDAEGFWEPAAWYEAAVDEAQRGWGVCFEANYEDHLRYAGVVVAVTSPGLAMQWRALDIGSLAVPVAALSEWCREHARSGMKRAVRAWEHVGVVGAANGVQMPDGRLLVVNNWD